MTLQALAPLRPDPLVEARVETLCQTGCRRVRQAIETLEQGGELPETRDLTPDQRRALLAELKSVMAVYGGACPIEKEVASGE